MSTLNEGASATSARSVDPLIGRTLAGRYKLISPLGSGGMSSVYLARHIVIERTAAIKILRPDLAIDLEQRERFLREARAVNRINHPSIVEISDYGELSLALTAGSPGRTPIVYLVMEYIAGETLFDLVVRERLTEVRLLPIAAQITAALARAHQTGVIHRDIKPENILLVARRDGLDVAKLTDFGVARLTEPDENTRGLLADQVLGTPGYIAPEYLLGETLIDGRADLYSLGVVMYEALAGTLPYDGSTATDLLVRPILEPPVPLETRVTGVDPALAGLVMRCLSQRPDDRPRDAFALFSELEAIAHRLGVAARLGVEIDGASLAPYRSRLASLDAAEPSGGSPRSTIGVAPALGEVTVVRLADAWRAHHRLLDARLRACADETLPVAVSEALNRRDSLIAVLERAALEMVATQHRIDELDLEARKFRGEMGNAIDVVARDLSAAHARVVELAERRTRLHLTRRHTDDGATEQALLWQEAAIDDELRRATATVDDLGHQVGVLQDLLFRRNETHDGAVLAAGAAIEGEGAAIATLHYEMARLSDELARFVGG